MKVIQMCLLTALMLSVACGNNSYKYINTQIAAGAQISKTPFWPNGTTNWNVVANHEVGGMNQVIVLDNDGHYAQGFSAKPIELMARAKFTVVEYALTAGAGPNVLMIVEPLN